MSGGRAELGLGAGWFEAEHAAYGLDFPDTPGRFDLLEEQLEVITGLWDTPVGEKYNFDGKHYQLKDSPALPKPVQQPHPPIIVGGGGKKRTPELTAKYAAEFNAGFSSVEETAARFTRVREACTAIGRDPETLGALHRAHRCRRQGRRRGQAPLRSRRPRPPEPWRRLIVGTPAEVVDHLGQLAEAGSPRQYVQILDLADLDHLDLIASDVLPHLR